MMGERAVAGAPSRIYIRRRGWWTVCRTGFGTLFVRYLFRRRHYDNAPPAPNNVGINLSCVMGTARVGGGEAVGGVKACRVYCFSVLEASKFGFWGCDEVVTLLGVCVESNGAKIIMTIRWSIVEKWRRPLRGFPGMDLNAIDFTHSDTFKASIWGGGEQSCEARGETTT